MLFAKKNIGEMYIVLTNIANYIVKDKKDIRINNEHSSQKMYRILDYS